MMTRSSSVDCDVSSLAECGVEGDGDFDPADWRGDCACFGGMGFARLPRGILSAMLTSAGSFLDFADPLLPVLFLAAEDDVALGVVGLVDEVDAFLSVLV